jgi:3'-phosphoadenosine 5'-phosphosulfate sulfotransferase (PAPS reductase)/FAD synthetase
MNSLLHNPLTDNLNGVSMLKQSIITIPLFLTLGCGPDTIVVIPQHSEEFPVPELEYIEASSESETEQLLYAERIIFEDEHAPEEEEATEQPVEEEATQEEQDPEEEAAPEEEPIEEEPTRRRTH